MSPVEDASVEDAPGQDTAPDGAVGQRVAVQRKLAGLTQQQLADRALISKSLISQVERGVVPASPAFTTTIARALRIDVDTLYGQPPPIDPQAEHAGIPALLTALDNYEDPDLDGPPMTASELRARLDECQGHREKSRYSTLVAVLPELLNHAYALAAESRPGIETETVWSLLDDAYALAQVAAFKFGYSSLGTLAARCGREATTRTGDPLRAAVGTFRYSTPRLHRGDHAGVLRVLDRGHRLLDGYRSPTAHAVRAHLHLRQAHTHARLGALDRADEHITEARHLIATGVPANPFYGVGATITNANMHWVAVPVEISDGTTAVGRAESVAIPSDVAPVRVGRHWIDLARAWTLHGDRAKALGALREARRVTPQQTRYHPQVHETVRILAETDRRATDTLAGFARWIGVTL